MGKQFFYTKLSNERYEHCPSIDTLLHGLIRVHHQSGELFEIFQKMTFYFFKNLKKNSWELFVKMISLRDKSEQRHETFSDDVVSRLQVSDLYKSDLQVPSQFANNFMWKKLKFLENK